MLWRIEKAHTQSQRYVHDCLFVEWSQDIQMYWVDVFLIHAWWNLTWKPAWFLKSWMLFPTKLKIFRLVNDISPNVYWTQYELTFDLNTNWRLTSILMILDYDYLICCIVHVDYLTTALDPGPLLCVLQILHLSCKINKHNQSTESTEMCIPSFCNKLHFIHAIS